MTRSRRTGQNGPFGTEELHDSYLFENVYGRCNKRIRFNLLLTSPVKKLSDVHRKPLIVLLNGFQCRAGWYSSYARYLASWGFHILQYNPPALQIIADTVEVHNIAAISCSKYIVLLLSISIPGPNEDFTILILYCPLHAYEIHA